MKAFLLAAGFGTRLKPFTDHHPKALATVNGITLLQRNIQYLQRFGIFDVVINVHHFADQILKSLQEADGFGSRYAISDETDAILETGGGLKKARPLLEPTGDFLAMNVDILSNIDLKAFIDYHLAIRPLASLAVQRRSSSRYFLFDESGTLKGWKHQKTGEEKIADGFEAQNLLPMAFSGIQIISSDIFDKTTLQGKFSLVDMYLELCSQEKIVAWDHTGDLLLDVGKPDTLARAAELF